jgi:hypothetical protein
MGYLDHLLATFFIDVTRLFISRFPHEGSSLQKIHDGFKQKYGDRISQLVTWSVQSRDTTYIIHKGILLTAYKRIEKGVHLPLLSTPTHQYGFVDPIIFIERLAAYQKENQLPETIDFQLALSRIASFNQAEALIEARKLKGEVGRIVVFLLDKEARPVPPFTIPSLWYMAGISRSPQQIFPEFKDFFYAALPQPVVIGNVPWRSFAEAGRGVLRLTLNTPPKIWQETPDKRKENLISKLTKLVTTPQKDIREDEYLLYEFLSLKADFLSIEHNDIQRFIYLFPSNPNPLLALVTAKSLAQSAFFSEVDKRMVIRTLEALVNLRPGFSDMTYLFIATCLLTNDKTARSFAAEIWIGGVSRGDVDSMYIGKIVGTHLSCGYAPMKRFTDLVSGSLLKITPAHNIAVESLLTSLIEHIQVEPPVGTKHLLEIYSEVLLLNRSALSSSQVKQKLESWGASASLKKIVQTILKST